VPDSFDSHAKHGETFLLSRVLPPRRPKKTTMYSFSFFFVSPLSHFLFLVVRQNCYRSSPFVSRRTSKETPFLLLFLVSETQTEKHPSPCVATTGAARKSHKMVDLTRSRMGFSFCSCSFLFIADLFLSGRFVIKTLSPYSLNAHVYPFFYFYFFHFSLQASAPIPGVSPWQRPVFLLNSRSSRFTATSPNPGRYEPWPGEAPLLPKLRG